MDLIATAKCGLLDRLFAGTFLIPMVPTVIALTAFALAHVLGRLFAHLFAVRPLELRRLLPAARIALMGLIVIVAAMMLVRGIAYPLFLLRMTKDAYYCSAFEAGRDLKAVHFVAFALMFLTHVACVALYDDRRFRRLQPRWLKAGLTGGYAVVTTSAYALATTLDAVLVPLMILFILPFACCGIGILARQR